MVFGAVINFFYLGAAVAANAATRLAAVPLKRDIAMKDSLRTGISFGLTSAVITTLGLMVGLHSGTHSKIVVLAGILTIAVADAF